MSEEVFRKNRNDKNIVTTPHVYRVKTEDLDNRNVYHTSYLNNAIGRFGLIDKKASNAKATSILAQEISDNVDKRIDRLLGRTIGIETKITSLVDDMKIFKKANQKDIYVSDSYLAKDEVDLHTSYSTEFINKFLIKNGNDLYLNPNKITDMEIEEKFLWTNEESAFQSNRWDLAIEWTLEEGCPDVGLIAEVDSPIHGRDSLLIELTDKEPHVRDFRLLGSLNKEISLMILSHDRKVRLFVSSYRKDISPFRIVGVKGRNINNNLLKMELINDVREALFTENAPPYTSKEKPFFDTLPSAKCFYPDETLALERVARGDLEGHKKTYTAKFLNPYIDKIEELALALGDLDNDETESKIPLIATDKLSEEWKPNNYVYNTNFFTKNDFFKRNKKEKVSLNPKKIVLDGISDPWLKSMVGNFDEGESYNIDELARCYGNALSVICQNYPLINKTPDGNGIFITYGNIDSCRPEESFIPINEQLDIKILLERLNQLEINSFEIKSHLDETVKDLEALATVKEDIVGIEL